MIYDLESSGKVTCMKFKFEKVNTIFKLLRFPNGGQQKNQVNIN